MNKIYPIFFSCLSFALSTLFITCKKADSNKTPVPPATNDTAVNQNVHIIDSSVFILNTDSTMLSQGIYEYATSNTTISFKENDIIVGETQGGYIRKITAINSQPGKYTFQTTQGTMEDVFKTTGFKFDINSDNLVRTLSGYTLPLNNILLYQDGPLAIKLTSGNLQFDADWNFGFNFKNSKLDTFEMSCKNVALQGQITLNISASQAVTLAQHSSSLKTVSKYHTIYVPAVILGVPVEVPVVIKTQLDFICTFSLTTDAKVDRDINFTSKNTLDLGIKYQNGQWQTIYNPQTNSSISTTNRSGIINVTTTFSLLPTVTMEIEGIAGPYASTGIKELVKGSVASPALDWDFYAGGWINTVLGAKAQIFGKSIGDLNHEWNTDTLHYETPYFINKISGDNQTGNFGSDLTNSLKVQVVDNNNETPQPNVPVYFTVESGGGTVSQESVLTDANGYAQTSWKLGASGSQEVQASAKKADGTLIGNAPVTFEAITAQSLPTVTTTAISAVTSSTASSGGVISNDGGFSITARGVCWSTSANPTTADSKTSDGTGTGTFTSNITGLTNNQTYHVRAYATNSAGTAYGNDVSFTASTNQITHLDGYYNIIGFTQSYSLSFDLNLQTDTGTINIPEGSYPATLTTIGTTLTCTSIFDYTYQVSSAPYTDHRTYVFSGQLDGNVYSGDVKLTIASPGATQTQDYQGTFIVQ